MGFVDRSFSGRIFRPKPEVHTEPDGRLLVITTPWGPRSSAQRAIQSVQDHFLSFRDDQEATSPFELLSCLSPMANRLRVAVMLTNDTIYNEENRNEYKSGVELIAVAKSLSEIAIVQVGQPQIFLDRPGFHLMPICTTIDLSTDLSDKELLLSPLPGQLLGTASTSNFMVHSLRLQSEDRLIFLSRSILPAPFYQITRGDRNIENISQMLSKDDPNNPFWLGIYDL